MNVLYKASVTSTSGRDGRALSSDANLDVKLSMPKELGGSGAAGTNPEQLFAAGYSACFLSALKFIASQAKIAVPADANVRAEVGIGQIDSGFALDVELFISLPGTDAAAYPVLSRTYPHAFEVDAAYKDSLPDLQNGPSAMTSKGCHRSKDWFGSRIWGCAAQACRKAAVSNPDPPE